MNIVAVILLTGMLTSILFPTLLKILAIVADGFLLSLPIVSGVIPLFSDIGVTFVFFFLNF